MNDRPIALRVSKVGDQLAIEVTGQAERQVRGEFDVEVGAGGNQSHHRATFFLKDGPEICLSRINVATLDPTWRVVLHVRLDNYAYDVAAQSNEP